MRDYVSSSRAYDIFLPIAEEAEEADHPVSAQDYLDVTAVKATAKERS
jgi:hypothetical protein